MYLLLPTILEHEGSQFYRLERRWRPKDLIPEPFRRSMLKDVQARFTRLEEAESEFQTLDRATFFLTVLRRMRLTVRDAKFAWRTDDLKFIESISNFYTDYGTILRNLKIEQARGRFNSQPEN